MRANERVDFDPMAQLSDPFETVYIRDVIVDKLWRKMPIYNNSIKWLKIDASVVFLSFYSK